MKTKNMLPLLVLGICCSVANLRAATFVVKIGGFFFNPTNLTIAVGDTVLWTNTVAATTSHDTTSTNAAFPWASGLLTSTNKTFTLTFTNAGTNFYFCQTHFFAPINPHREQTGRVFVVSANLAPTVSLTNPADNMKFRAPTNILLQASASDDGTVTNVQFFTGGTSLGSDPIAPYSLALNNLAPGNYSFTARAQDNTGLSATSAAVNVFVLTNALLTAPAILPGGQFRFTLQGIAGQTYATEVSTNLATWSALSTNIAPADSFNVTDFTSTNVLLKFYRARQDL